MHLIRGPPDLIIVDPSIWGNSSAAVDQVSSPPLSMVARAAAIDRAKRRAATLDQAGAVEQAETTLPASAASPEDHVARPPSPLVPCRRACFCG